MKTILIFIYLMVFGFAMQAQQQVLKSTDGKDIRFYVRNVCQDYGQIIICDGNDSANLSPTIGSLGCYGPQHFFQIDSLLLFNRIDYFDIDETGGLTYDPKLMCLGNDSLLLTYKINYSTYCDSPNVVGLDTIVTDSIAGISVSNNQLVYIRNTSMTNNIFNLYSNPFSLRLNITPLFVSNLYDSHVAVVGLNQNNETELIIIHRNTQQILFDTVLSPFMSNPVALNFSDSYHLYVVSSPGDSIVNLMTYDFINNTVNIETIYNGSGINVFAFSVYYGFIFQPSTDTSINSFDKQLFFFRYNTHALTNYNINKRLKVLVNPGGNHNQFSFLCAVEDLPSTNILFVYDIFNLQLFDSLITDANPKFYRSDFRCPLSVTEYDDSKVEWLVFPNPSNSEFNLAASGLICGREYKVDIIDITGRVKFETIVHAKTTVTLPTGKFLPGVYFIRIHSLKGLVVQKIIKL